MKLPALIIAFVALSVFAGCSSSSGGAPACATITGCGGSVVGTWKTTSSCESVSGMQMPNANCTLGASGSAQVSGTLTTTSAMTYMLSITTTGTESVSVPASCLNGASCDSVTQQLQSTYPGANCAGAGGGCDCSVPVNTTQNESGSFATQGNTVTLSPSGGTPYTLNYCVNGSQLTVGEQTTSMGLTTTGTVTFQKQ